MASLRILAPTADFGFDLLRSEVTANPNQNVLVSPASVSIALGMTASGALGSTRSAMVKALGLSDLYDNNLAYSRLLSALNGKDLGVELDIANAIWARQGLNFVPEFLENNRQNFRAAVNVADFSQPQTVNDINTWVSDSTKKRIPTIIQEIEPDTIMYLLNATYFKGQFRTQFNPALTAARDFRTPRGARPHAIMHRHGDIRYTEDGIARLVALPFGDSDKRVNLYVLLPQPGHTIEDVVNALNAEVFFGYFRQLRAQDVRLSMPKFEMEYDVSLNSSLKRLGMEEAFDHRADFSGLLPKSEGDVFIGEVKHKTFARVDEKGAEAAAVTSVRMVLECMIRPVEFAVNEPFAALIADEDTGSVLFAGVINDPQVCKD